MNTIKRILSVACVAGFVTGHACAQFPGALFFQEPAIVVEEGAQAELVVETFVGTSTFGIATFDVLFDPLQFEIEAVEVITTDLTSATGYGVDLSDRFAQAVVNDASLSEPFGSVELVRVVGRPLVSAGQSVQLTLQPRSVLDTQGLAIGNPAGFSASITVTSASALASSLDPHAPQVIDSAYPIAPWLDPLHGAVPYRRPGHVVPRWSFDHGPKYAPLLHHEQYVDASAPRDY